MTELARIKKAIERLKDGTGQIWLYRLNRNRERECVGASRLRLSLKTAAKKAYFEALAKAVLGEPGEQEGGFDHDWTEVREYTGSEGEQCVFWLPTNDGKITNAWTNLHGAKIEKEKRLLKALEVGNVESVSGVGISMGQGQNAVEFLSARSPVKTLKFAFWSFNDGLEELGKQIIILPQALDAVAFGGRVYFFGPKVKEQLWSREEEKRQVRETIDKNVDRTRLSNPELFEKRALTGLNRRRMLEFQKTKWDALLDSRKGKQAGHQFGVRVENGKVITDEQTDVDHLVKLVTNRGMVDPFEETPMSVVGAATWE